MMGVRGAERVSEEEKTDHGKPVVQFSICLKLGLWASEACFILLLTVPSQF